jgi:hypothetical protein
MMRGHENRRGQAHKLGISKLELVSLDLDLRGMPQSYEGERPSFRALATSINSGERSAKLLASFALTGRCLLALTRGWETRKRSFIFRR